MLNKVGFSVKEHLQNFVIVSVFYVTAYSLTLGFVAPLQQLVFTNVIYELSLLFLPHGVRVLAIYFFSWRGVLYLIPSAYLMKILSYQAGIPLDPWSPLFNILACYVGFELVRLALPKRFSGAQFPKWRYFGLVALFGSIFNSAAMTLLHQNELNLFIALGYVIGDMAGFFVCFFILIYGFRFARLLAKVEDA